MPTKNTDWNSAETQFVTGRMTLKELAEAFSVSVSAVRAHARAGGWSDKRTAYRRDVVEKTVSACADREADKLVRLIAVSDRAVETVEKALLDDKQLFRYVITEKTDSGQEMREQILGKMDTKALRDITSSLKDLALVVRDINDIPTRAQQEDVALKREKLELDKRKNESENSSFDKTITVEFKNEDYDT